MVKKKRKGNWISNWIIEMYNLQTELVDIASGHDTEAKPTFFRKYGLELGYYCFFLGASAICYSLGYIAVARIFLILIGLQIAMRISYWIKSFFVWLKKNREPIPPK